MRYWWTLSLFILSWGIKAQEGHYYIQHYHPVHERLNTCFDIAQDGNGLFYFATRFGILQFDGLNWDLTPSVGAIYTVAFKNNELFWGGAQGFGKMEKSGDGTRTIKTLSNNSVADIYQALVVGNSLYFQNDTAVYFLDEANAIEPLLGSEETGSFLGLHQLGGIPYVATENKGLIKLERGKMSHAKKKLGFGLDILFTASLGNDNVIVTTDNRFFTNEGPGEFREVKLESGQYASAGVIVSGCWVHNGLFALGTLRGGVLFIHPKTGKTVQIVNYNTGLPDNEVFTLFSDSEQHVWVAHPYGYSMIAPSLPIRSLNHFDGLEGNILCAESSHGQFYVGTSQGVYKLIKEDTYDEIVYYVDVKTPVSNRATKRGQIPKTEEPVLQNPIPEKKKSRRGIFWFLKRERESPLLKDESQSDNTRSDNGGKYVLKREKKIEKILRSSQYVYKKVQGIETKTTQLIYHHNHFIAAGLGGAFVINGLESLPIIEEPIRFVYGNGQTLIASTHEDKILSLNWTDKGWGAPKIIQNLDDQITYIFEGGKGELWLCGMTGIYQMDVTGAKGLKSFKLSNFNNDNVVGLKYNGLSLIVNSSGFFSFQEDKGMFVKIDSLPNPRSYFAESDKVWYKDGLFWKELGNPIDNPVKNTSLLLLNAFKNIRHITSFGKSDTLCFVSGSNELFNLFAHRKIVRASLPLFLRSSMAGGKMFYPGKGRVRIEEQLPISFEVVLPGFLGSDFVEYRYTLKGLDKKWTAWGPNNNFINLPYLPTGKYTVFVQSRDAFGGIQDLIPIDFEVIPQFWKSPWFYAMEFSMISLLVWFSFRLSIKYQIISRLLSLLSIILLIAFIQSIVGARFTNTSPLFNFLIQVFVALLILPVEEYLRKLMFRSIDSSRKMYRIARYEGEQEDINK